ncbi:MAG: phosphate ABC transporter substrate-binding protein [Methanobrevibacter sp.]|uniref:phosphate ABC transporter substrate-binding protein n=1 Tax=Methanobrevibacter sp. TaxID=66852 RepID=UPI0025E33970|nr:phosphate ABC transporter substrate-binding protein [Methanobrevibacter sp.]MBQ8017971.1 phosphate ABC transporter substrate-binding protein [Methanobrevibacter sp.]
MKTNYKIITVLLIIFSVLTVNSIQSTNEPLSIVGSTSIQPVCEQLAEEYKKTHDNVDINIQGGGSSLGIKCAKSDVADIGMSSKEIDCENLEEHEIGREAIIVIVNNENPINDLSTKHLQKIFSGEIKNWRELTNISGEINVIIREEGSGTLDSFKSTVMKNQSFKKDAIIQNSAGSVKQSVIQDRNAIGFVSFAHLDDSIKNISIDKVSPSKESVIEGTYKLQRPFILLSDKNCDNKAKEFINWTMSEESDSVLDKEKIIR